MIDAPPDPTPVPSRAAASARRRSVAAAVAGAAAALTTAAALASALADGFARPLVGLALALALVAANLAPVLAVSRGRIDAFTPVGALLVPIGLLLPLPEAVVVYALGETVGVLAAHRWDRLVGGPEADAGPRTAFVVGKSIIGAALGILALRWVAGRGEGVPFQVLAAFAGVTVSTVADRVALAGVTAWVRSVPFRPELQRGAADLALVGAGEVVAGALIAVLASRDPWSLVLGLAMLALLLVATSAYARAAADHDDTSELLRLAEELQQAATVDEVAATLLASVRRLLPEDDIALTTAPPDEAHRGWHLDVPGGDDRWLTTPRLVDTRDYDAQPLVVVEAAVSLARVALTRAAAQELLVQQDELRALVLSTVAHDLRGPLSTALGSFSTLSQLGDQLDAESRDDLVAIAERSVVRMRRLLDDLLALEAGDDALVAGRADIAAELPRLLDELDLPGVRLEVTVSPAEAAIDPVSLQRVVENLVVNAAKFSPAGGRVGVAAEPTDGGVAITVTDQGPGISVLDRERIFRPFEQVERRRDGVGLGLYVARRFVERNGGRISVGDAPGGGAAFTVWFPEAA